MKTSADTTITAAILVALGVTLLGAALSTHSARRRARLRLEPRAALQRAEALRQEGKLRDARALLLRASTRFPDDSALLYRLACCHSLLGEHREALASLKHACDIDPNWAVSAMHDPDVRDVIRTASAGRTPRWLQRDRVLERSRAA